ncbi:MAG: arsenate reductase (glutaredoxin) [Hyphomicrobiales bacterium]
MKITIYHNPKCGTSRNTLEMIRAAGYEPEIIEYLKTPPSRETLINLMAEAEITPRKLLREKGTPYQELGLENTELLENELIDHMMDHPILINRPLVKTEIGTRLCRPSEVVLDILPEGKNMTFTKEDGEVVGRNKV